MEAAVKASPLWSRYAEPVDRESAREKLAARLEEGARKAAEDARAEEVAREAKAERSRKPAPAPKAPKAPKEEEGVLETVVTSPVFKDFMRTAAREIARGMFKSGRR
jgi:Ribonuclease G/E